MRLVLSVVALVLASQATAWAGGGGGGSKSSSRLVVDNETGRVAYILVDANFDPNWQTEAEILAAGGKKSESAKDDAVFSGLRQGWHTIEAVLLNQAGNAVDFNSFSGTYDVFVGKGKTNLVLIIGAGGQAQFVAP